MPQRAVWCRDWLETNSHTDVDQPGENLKWDPGKGSSMESSQRKSCCSETTSVLWAEGLEWFSFTSEKARFQQLPCPKTWEIERSEKWAGGNTWHLAHPWVLEKLKGALPWHLVEWQAGAAWQREVQVHREKAEGARADLVLLSG